LKFIKIPVIVQWKSGGVQPDMPELNFL